MKQQILTFLVLTTSALSSATIAGESHYFDEIHSVKTAQGKGGQRLFRIQGKNTENNGTSTVVNSLDIRFSQNDPGATACFQMALSAVARNQSANFSVTGKTETSRGITKFIKNVTCEIIGFRSPD